MAGRPKGSKNRVSADTLEAFAERVIRTLAKSDHTETLERLICRLLTGDDVKVAAALSAKVVEWKYGKPVQPVTAEQTTTFVFDAQRPAREEPLPDRPSDTYVQ